MCWKSQHNPNLIRQSTHQKGLQGYIYIHQLSFIITTSSNIKMVTTQNGYDVQTYYRNKYPFPWPLTLGQRTFWAKCDFENVIIQTRFCTLRTSMLAIYMLFVYIYIFMFDYSVYNIKRTIKANRIPPAACYARGDQERPPPIFRQAQTACLRNHVVGKMESSDWHFPGSLPRGSVRNAATTTTE